MQLTATSENPEGVIFHQKGFFSQLRERQLFSIRSLVNFYVFCLLKNDGRGKGTCSISNFPEACLSQSPQVSISRQSLVEFWHWSEIRFPDSHRLSAMTCACNHMREEWLLQRERCVIQGMGKVWEKLWSKRRMGEVRYLAPPAMDNA